MKIFWKYNLNKSEKKDNYFVKTGHQTSDAKLA